MPWPVDDPPKPRLRTNIKVAGTPVLSPAYDGPLNVLITLHRAQQAAVEVMTTDKAYNEMEPGE